MSRRITRHTGARGHDDRGATLIELLISIAVMGYVSAALLAMVATFMRNDDGPGQRITESRDLLRVASTLSDDVSSASMSVIGLDELPADGVIDSIAPNTAPSCPGFARPGWNVLALDWVEDFGGSVSRHRAQYWLDTTGTTRRLVRLECTGSPLSTAAVTTVATQLATVDPAVITLDGPTVTLRLVATSGRVHELTASSQNDGAELEISQEDE
jgi:type II secretory pathway pseudopilin PulG